MSTALSHPLTVGYQVVRLAVAGSNAIATPTLSVDPERSPWEGMSGAAVWSAGRIIGLVAEHHRSDGLGRFAATRVDRWYERLAAERLDQLRAALSDLPARRGEFREVLRGVT